MVGDVKTQDQRTKLLERIDLPTANYKMVPPNLVS